MLIPAHRSYTQAEIDDLAHYNYVPTTPTLQEATLPYLPNDFTFSELRIPPSLRASVAAIFNIQSHQVRPQHIGLFLIAYDHQLITCNTTARPALQLVAFVFSHPIYNYILSLKTPTYQNHHLSTIPRIIAYYRPILPPTNPPTITLALHNPPYHTATMRLPTHVYNHYLEAYHAYRIIPSSAPRSDNHRVLLAIEATFTKQIPAQEPLPDARYNPTKSHSLVQMSSSHV